MDAVGDILAEKEGERFPWAGGTRARGRAPSGDRRRVFRLVPRTADEARAAARGRRADPLGRIDPRRGARGRPRPSPPGRRSRSRRRKRRRRPPRRPSCCRPRKRKRRKPTPPPSAPRVTAAPRGPELSLPSSGEGTGGSTRRDGVRSRGKRRDRRRAIRPAGLPLRVLHRGHPDRPVHELVQADPEHSGASQGALPHQPRRLAWANPRSCARADCPSSIGPPSAPCSPPPSRPCPPTGRGRTSA